ncbi:MsnO8 family LLM class oxidoreductase [Stackebrandtia albiflava]|uniref:MsnO8 family LLM class oxidoreductase n=1 Tax=Stackebrandtia albiflava TaxID=406432 RepID=UPI001479434E
MPLSILDRSGVRAGETPEAALRATVAMAEAVERLGFHRFWVSEHHSVPGIAGSAPTVLAAAVAARTSRIRVGTGGVMLPNHSPLVVAEQFGVLEALYPGRIDLGLGRSTGFTPAVRAALRGTDADDHAERVTELLGYLRGDQTAFPGVRARPGEGSRPRPFLLATGAGAALAAELGLPLVIAPVRGASAMREHIDAYRSAFVPSDWSSRSHVVVSASVAVADSETRARDLLISEAWSTATSRTGGEFPPLWDPADVHAVRMTERQRRYLDQAMRGGIAGTAAQVRRALTDVVSTSGADELLITTAAFDRERQLDSHARLVDLAADLPTSA